MQVTEKTIDDIFAQGDAIDTAINKGIAQALRRHKQAGVPIVVWRDGKVVHIPPEQIVIEEQETSSAGGRS